MSDYRPNRFQVLPVIIKNLLIINGIFFLAQNTIGERFFNLEDLFALHTFQSPLFRPWQLVTHLFMHGGLGHIFSNMLALWMFGSVLENHWGPKRFLTFYLVCGIGAALGHMTVLFIENQNMLYAFHHLSGNDANIQAFVNKYPPMATVNTLQGLIDSRLNEATIGASGAVFGCLAAFGFLFPDTLIYFYFFIPLKAKWFVLLYAAFELYSAVKDTAGDNVAHVAHLGGALVGLVIVYVWNKKKRDTFY